MQAIELLLQLIGVLVKRIGIDKNNRHKDTIAFRDFWTKLDEFLAEKRKRGDFEIAY